MNTTPSPLPEVRTVLDSLDDPMVLLNGDGTVVAVNEAWQTFARNHGLEDHSGMVGDDYFTASRQIPAEDVEQIQADLRKVLGGEKQQSQTVYACHTQSEQRWMEMSASGFDDGDERYVTVTHADITAQDPFNQERTDRTRRQKLAQDMAHLGHWTVRIPERIVECSDEIFRIFDLDPTRSDLSLEDAYGGYHEDDRKAVRKDFEKALQSGEPVDITTRIRRPDGEVRYVKMYGEPRYGDAGDIDEVFGVLQDVTDQKRVELELRESQQRFRQFAENVREVFWILDLETEQYLYLSPSYKSVWGPIAESLRDNPWAFLEAVHPEDRDRVENELTRLATGDYDVEYRIQRSDGEIHRLHDRAYPIENDEGEVTQVAGITEDISDRSEIKKQLQNRAREKETLLQEILHRVKNNLQVIISLLRLQARSLDNEEATNALLKTEHRLQTMAMIHKKLYEKFNASRINFAEYIEDLVDMIRKSHLEPDQTVEFNLDLPSVNLDVGTCITCGLMINELVTNALEHAFSDDRSGSLDIQFFTDASSDHHLVVKDSGSGVDLETMKRRDSLGFELVQTLATDQLHGKIEITHEDGLRVEVIFPPRTERYE